jgi:5-methylcytosine-specific restriction endonuclease McrA
MILVLNADYTPLTITPLKRAFRLVYKGKAEIVSSKGEGICTDKKDYDRPSIIRLNKYVKFPYKKVTLSRFNIYKRDEYKCGYCGSKDSLTLDHVIPKSKGGPNSWKNLITCCMKCNVTKGDKSLEESGMVLLHKPFTPSYLFFLKKLDKFNEDWKPYLMTND